MSLWLEKNREILITGGIFLLCYLCLLVLALRPPYAFDSFWHLKMGKDLLLNGMSPWIDHYSFTYFEKDIVSVPVLFQVILASFFIVFGDDNGFYTFKIFYISLLFIFIWSYFRQIKASWLVAFLIMPIIVYFIHTRLIIRPDILSNILVIICLSLYLKASKNFGNKELLLISLLLLFWVNYHTPVFGYVIIFGLFVDKAIKKLTQEDDSWSWGHWIKWGLIIFMIGFVNLEGSHFFISMLMFVGSDFGKYIQEYMPAYEVFEIDRMVHLSWVVSLVLVVVSWLRKQYGFIFIVIFLLYFSINMSRLIPTVALINFCILAYYLSQVSFKHDVLKFKPLVVGMISIIYIMVTSLSLYTLVTDMQITVVNHTNKYKIIKERYPYEVADYLEKYEQGGNVLNSLRTGGYLVNKLPSDFKVYIDGRTNILYPVEFFIHAYNVFNDPVKMEEEIEKNDIQYVIYKNEPGNYMKFSKIEKLHLIFSDEAYLLFAEKSKAGFPVVSKLLLFPMCWSSDLEAGISNEIKMAKEIFKKENYSIIRNLNILDSYISKRAEMETTKVPVFLNELADSERRLSAYAALNYSNYDAAAEEFSRIDSLGEYDLLMLSYSYLKAEKFDSAEAALNYYMEKSGYMDGSKKLSLNASIMIYQILSVINMNIKLNIFPGDFIALLEASIRGVAGKNYEIPEWRMPHESACKLIFQ